MFPFCKKDSEKIKISLRLLGKRRRQKLRGTTLFVLTNHSCTYIHYSLTQKYVPFYPLQTIDGMLKGDLAKVALTVFHQPTALCQGRSSPLPIIAIHLYYTFFKKMSIVIFDNKIIKATPRFGGFCQNLSRFPTGWHKYGRYPCARRASAACLASNSRSKSPNTEGPLPLIIAFSAP